MASTDLLLVAGEASGDLHGAALLRELTRLGVGTHVFGLGGERLRAQGMETVADFSALSVVGLGAVLKVVPLARRILKDLLSEVDRRGTRIAVLIDFPEFNLRLARKLKKRGVRVIYYVSPQVWAWRRGRLGMISKVVDKMLVLFAFEVDFYREHLAVEHVGHPLVDEVPELPQAWEKIPADDLPERYRIALLPGSRRSEIERILPIQLAAAKKLASNLPCSFVVIRAPSIPRQRLEDALADTGMDIPITCSERFEAIARSHLALCASGTATLEIGLLGTPMIVVYQVGLVSSLLGRMLLKVDTISLVNLVLRSPVVKELVQREATAERIGHEALELLTDRGRCDAMRSRLAGLRSVLGEPGASRRAAAIIASEMDVTRTSA